MHNAKLQKKEFSVFHADLLCVRDTADLCQRLASAMSRLERTSGFLEKRLTPLQMRVLKALAEKGGTEIYATGFLAAASTRNAASVKRAIDKLVREGLVFAREKEYRFVNPFFREWVKRHWQA